MAYGASSPVVIGKVGKPFGIKGEIRVIAYTESTEAFFRSEVLVIDNESYRTRSVRPHKGGLLVSLEGIDTPEQAKEFTGNLIKTDPGNLPPKEEDEYYWYELIGMAVHTHEGRFLGTVKTLIRTGANDVLEVHGELGEILLPMIDDVIREIDLERGLVIVDPLEGLVPDG